MATSHSRPRRSRYGRYTGGPDPLAPPVDLSDALRDIADDVMAGYSLSRHYVNTCAEAPEDRKASMI